MCTYFIGWRRKLGCVTLLLALVFLGGWARSGTYSDSIFFPIGKQTRVSFESENGYLFVEYETHKMINESARVFWLSLFCCDPDEVYLYYLDDTVGWRFHCFAVGTHEINHHARGDLDSYEPPGFVRKTWFASYWTIIAPLTALSAWLLIGTRRKTQATVSGSISKDQP